LETFVADPAQRRLAAILAADVAGYSRLMGEDEEGTLATLTSHLSEMIAPCIGEHRGRLFKTMGDGFLAEFASVVEAVQCAIAIQDGMGARNAGVAEPRRMDFRIGVNLGDVIAQDDDLFGDGVNVAARLETLAKPGGICISRAARDQVRDRMAIALEDLGEVSVKNIARPVRCFAVNRDSGQASASSNSPRQQISLKPSEKPSVAVLPFDNLSGDPEQDFFADGMAEDVITALSKLRWFFVIARNSTFAYKGQSPDVRQVARELGVRYVLEGSVRKAGERVRIAAQLIDGATGNHLWAERFDRQVVDIFEVQDDITRSVVRALEPQLYAAETLRIRSNPPESLDAWGCVIRALWHLERFTKDDNEQALQLLRQAVGLSPDYAKAHSVLAFAEARRVFFGDDIEATLSVARQSAQTAVALDCDDPWGYFSTGYIVCFTSKYDEAIAWYRRAIELNENFALAHGNIAAALALGGQPDAAIEAVELSMRMSPRDPFNFAYLHFAAIAHFAAGNYAEGIACEERALRERPKAPPALRFLAACHAELGQMDEARRAIVDVLRLAPQSSIKRDVYGQVAYARETDRERYAAALRKAGLPEE
jgi:TolB-like protein/Flp pilus assembly protein TadD